MLTSKERAELRAQANGLETTLIVGKDGISESVIAEAELQLTVRELVKGRVLESAMLTAAEAADELCGATHAEAVQTVGSKFVIYRFSEKKRKAEAAKASAKKKPVSKALANPVRKGVQKRRMKAKQEREKKDAYFHDAAVKAAIERRKSDKENEK